MEAIMADKSHQGALRSQRPNQALGRDAGRSAWASRLVAMRLVAMRLAAACLSAASLTMPTAAVAAWPERTVTIVNPFAPGGISDIIARLTAARLQGALKQPFIVENVPGVAGIVAAERVLKSAPDGYTLMSTPIFQLTMAPFTNNVTFDASRDFKPISAVAGSPFVITVAGSFPGNTLADFIAHVKSNAGKITYGSAGAGSLTHISSVVFLKSAGLNMIHVPYRGVAPAFTDLLAGHIAMVSATPVELKPYLESGKVKPLAVTGVTRSKHLPNVPTVMETLRSPPVITYNGLLAPARTPQDVADLMSRELVAAGKDAEFVDRFLKAGLEPIFSTAEEFAKIIADDTKQWREIVSDLNLKSQ
jgi:tripartite-type tricarboxylate transporter receptor subunit TctC